MTSRRGCFTMPPAFDIPLRSAARAGTRQKRESQQGRRHPKGNEFVQNCLRRLGGEAPRLAGFSGARPALSRALHGRASEKRREPLGSQAARFTVEFAAKRYFGATSRQ